MDEQMPCRSTKRAGWTRRQAWPREAGVARILASSHRGVVVPTWSSGMMPRRTEGVFRFQPPRQPAAPPLPKGGRHPTTCRSPMESGVPRWVLMILVGGRTGANPALLEVTTNGRVAHMWRRAALQVAMR